MTTDELETVTDDEMLRITNAFIATSNALGDAILALKRVEAVTFDHDELDDVVLQRRRVEDDYADNERSFLAFSDGDIGMRPPTDDDVAAIVQVAGQLAVLTQQKATASAIVQLANQINAAFNDVRPR